MSSDKQQETPGKEEELTVDHVVSFTCAMVLLSILAAPMIVFLLIVLAAVFG